MKPLAPSVLLLVVAVAATADAAPAPSVAIGKKVVAPSSLRARLGRTITKNGVTKSAESVLDTEFDGTETVTLADGTKVGLQEMLDRIGAAESKAQSNGATLTTLPKKAPIKSSTVTKLSAQRLAFGGENAPVASSNTRPPSVGAGCTAADCIPYETEKAVTWSAEKGDSDIVAAYSSFGVKAQMPDAYAAGCSATWDNGVYLLGDKHSVLKFTAGVSSKKKPVTWSANAALYVLGQSTPVWKKDVAVDKEPLDRTFKTPEAKLLYTLIPGVITASGSLQAAATLSFRPMVNGNAGAADVSCTLGIQPRLVASVTGGVAITVGIDKLAELATGGLKGDLRAADVALPTSLGLSVAESPLKAAVDFQSDLDTKLVGGRFYVFYKLADICNKKGTFCLVEDVLGVSTYGEYDLWDWDGFVYSKNLASYHGALGWKRR
jgi:hypothetical protein